MYKTNLKKLKECLNINSLELAEKLGISYSTLGSYERGKRTPSIDFILLLAEKLKVNPNWLLLGIGDIFLEKECNTLKIRNEIFKTEESKNFTNNLSDIQKINKISDKEMAKILGIFENNYNNNKNLLYA